MSNDSNDPVRKFLVSIYNEKKWDWVWEEINKISELDYEEAMSKLVNISINCGFPFSKKEWESCIKEIICNYINNSKQENRKIIKLLKKPPNNHSEGLKKYVYEICDYGGDPEWNEKEDYYERVKYVIDVLQEQIEDSSEYILSGCNQEQLQGKGWIPEKAIGLTCKPPMGYSVFILWKDFI